jgi:plastocyanin
MPRSRSHCNVSFRSSTLAVSAGDTIRFEVTDGGNSNAHSDVTAWTPSIVYQ